MTEPLINITRADKILHLQFNRPQRKNAITLAMYTTLADTLNAAAEDQSVRVVLLSGTDGCFTAGNDLQDFMNDANIREGHPVERFLRALLQFPKPVVAAISGPAVGIGTTLLLQCDLAYADSSARFQMPFVNLGLCPEYASSYLLPRLLGQARAAELLLLGETFGAEAAREYGIINAVTDDALTTAWAQAERLAAQPPAAVRATKALLRAPVRASVEAVMMDEFKAFAAGLAGEEFKEAVGAFFEKRKPDFSRFS